MDYSAMRTAIFNEDRALRFLRASLERNIGHADGILSSITKDSLPLTVFKKAMVQSVLAAPDIYERVDQSELAAAYQAYEIVDRVIAIKIANRPIGINYPDLDWLLQNHSKDARERSARLVEAINTIVNK